MFLNSLNNERIKRILISPDASDARVLLCDFYISNSISSSCMHGTVAILKDTIVKMERRRVGDAIEDY